MTINRAVSLQAALVIKPHARRFPLKDCVVKQLFSQFLYLITLPLPSLLLSLTDT